MCVPRSVFVPYFRYLVAPAVEQMQAASAATEPKKKKRKKDRDSDAATVSTAEEALLWRLRLQVRGASGVPHRTAVTQTFCRSCNGGPGCCVRVSPLPGAATCLPAAVCR